MNYVASNSSNLELTKLVPVSTERFHGSTCYFAEQGTPKVFELDKGIVIVAFAGSGVYAIDSNNWKYSNVLIHHYAAQMSADLSGVIVLWNQRISNIVSTKIETKRFGIQHWLETEGALLQKRRVDLEELYHTPGLMPEEQIQLSWHDLARPEDIEG